MVLSRTVELFQRLQQAGITAIVTYGNHDPITEGRDEESWLVYLQRRGLLLRPTVSFSEEGYHFTPVDCNGVRFWGLGYPGAMAEELLAALGQRLESEPPSSKQVVLIHSAPVGSEFLHGTISPDFVTPLLGKVCYIAGGHLHSFSRWPAENPLFFVPGSTDYWDLGESSSGKGAVLFDTDSGVAQHLPVVLRTRIQATLESGDEISLEEKFGQWLHSLVLHAQEEIVQLRIIRTAPFSIDTITLEERILQAGALKATVTVATNDQRSGSTTDNALAGFETLERQCIADWPFFGSRLNEVHQTLTLLKEYQRSQQTESFTAQLQTLLDTLTESDLAS